ncbi:MAG: leucine-rich repeat protein, partial [Lachnospiraceae bacterium]|nr:leucine-rich repeat protein [Lachnospiraceae bacterium]
TWANATAMTRDNSLSGYWYSAKITLPQGQTAYALVKNSNGQQRPEAQSTGYAVSGNTWVDLYGSVSSSKPSVVPTEVPATPTPAPATPTPLPDESQKLSADFKFEKQDSSSTVLLEKYIGTSKELTVQASYRLNGKTYKTVLPECTEKNGSIFTSNRTLEKITFEDGVRTTGNSLDRMFNGCMALKQINGMNELLRNNNIVDISQTFMSCPKLEYGLGELVLPSTVIYTNHAFNGCTSLKYTAKLDGTPSMKVAEAMYHNCSSLVSVSFDIPKSLENADFMFEGCSSLEYLPKNTVDSGLKTAVGMFSGCSSATDIVFYFKNLTLVSCRNMFVGCGKLGTSRVIFDLYGACPGSNIISYAGLNDIAKDNTTVRVESGYKSDWQKDLPSGFKVETMR